MFSYFTPANWFWIFIAILLSCYLRLASARPQHAVPTFRPASIISLFWRV